MPENVNDYFRQAALDMKKSAEIILSQKFEHDEPTVKFAEEILKISNKYLKQTYVQKH
jgi:hypothetical protein